VKAASGDDDQNAPARFFELTAAERRVVLFWIRSVMKTAENPSETTSYGMKHHCEEEAGFYICNGFVRVLKSAKCSLRCHPRRTTPTTPQ
jgi:hypothetical protein